MVWALSRPLPRVRLGGMTGGSAEGLVQTRAAPCFFPPTRTLEEQALLLISDERVNEGASSSLRGKGPRLDLLHRGLGVIHMRVDSI